VAAKGWITKYNNIELSETIQRIHRISLIVRVTKTKHH